MTEESPAGARSRYNDSAGSEGQVVARIKAVPDGAEGEGKERAVLLGHSFIDKRSQPAVGAAVPVVDGIAHVR